MTPRPAGRLLGVENDEVLTGDEPRAPQIEPRRQPGLAATDDDDWCVGAADAAQEGAPVTANAADPAGAMTFARLVRASGATR